MASKRAQPIPDVLFGLVDIDGDCTMVYHTMKEAFTERRFFAEAGYPMRVGKYALVEECK